MDKLQEVKKFDITIFTSWLKKYAECGVGLEKAWHFLIEQAELAEKRQEIIEENKRQQDVTVHQFRRLRKSFSGLIKRTTGLEKPCINSRI
ncbi:VWA domain-containing protein [Bacillus subtilis]|uniref:VWA domain-containing protein n=1 Tax=Bacillus subtilis TaxID=1423 RepID=UPI00234BADBE|nr:VWA domain-containing protein [Bacillus subtilis]WCL64267.1 VWA domain-containing protein [Bacillus subtilis]